MICEDFKKIHMGVKDNKFSWGDSVTLKEYLSQRMDDLEEKIQVNFDLQKVALDKSDVKLDERLRSMNEFRAQMKDQSETFITRNEVMTLIDTNRNEIRDLRESRAKLEGKASQSSMMIALGFSLVALIIEIVSFFVKFL